MPGRQSTIEDGTFGSLKEGVLILHRKEFLWVREKTLLIEGYKS